MTRKEASNLISPSIFSSAIGVLLISVSLYAIAGWLTDYPPSFFLPEAPTMKVNTAIGNALCGAALLTFGRNIGRFKAEMIPSFFLIIISALTLSQYYLQTDLNIDNILIKDNLSSKYPGRPSEATALTLLFAGISILLYSAKKFSNPFICDLPILIGLFIPLFCLSSYIYNYESVSSVAFIEFMALPTALSFTLFFVGLALTQPASLIRNYFCDASLTFRELRRLSFPVIIFPIAMGWIAQYLIREQNIAPEVGIAALAAICSIVATIGLLWNSHKESEWQNYLASEQKAKLLAQSHLSFALETSMGGVFIFSSRGDVVAVNGGASLIFGWNIEELKAMNLRDFIPPRLRESHSHHVESFRHSEKEKQVNDNLLNMVGYHKSGKEIPILVSINKQKIDGEMMFGAVIMDASRISTQLAHFKAQAETDYLTDVANRQGLDSYLSSLRRDHPGLEVSLLMIDIDHFKRVNDTYGHAAGDDLLQAFVKRIQSVLRFHDKLFRLGGEEFLVVSKRQTHNNAKVLADRIRHRISSETFACRHNELSVTCSIGVANARINQNDLSEQIHNADAALYVAKEEGRNCVRIYDEIATEADPSI